MALKLTTVGFSFSRAYGIEFPVSTQPLVNECVGVQEWGGGYSCSSLRLYSVPKSLFEVSTELPASSSGVAVDSSCRYVTLRN